jgi:hypothetical protein
MTHSASKEVWYTLVDQRYDYNGETTTSKVNIDGNVDVDVDDFRRRVRQGYLDENSVILSRISATQLLVYKNRAAFDKRNVEDGNEQPLDEDSLIGGLGDTKEEALIVLVPSSVQLAFQSFRLCNVSFYRNICNATESDGWISFGQDNIPSTNLKMLYIRESYRTIGSSGIKKAIITGTPGIGKSLFLIYLLWKLVKERKRVLFIYRPFNVYYDGKGGIFLVDTIHIPTSSNTEFWNESLWCLFDTRGKTDDHLYNIPYELGTFITSTFPRQDFLHDFLESPQPEVFFMPLWTEAELEAVSPLFPITNEWRDRFEILGGIPREVLEETLETPTEMLKEACTNCSLDDCVKKIGMCSTITERTKVYHYLVHMTSVPPFTNSSVCYASPTALNTIIRYKGDEAKFRMRELLATCEGNPLMFELLGGIFKINALELLESGGRFTCRKLVSRNTRKKPPNTVLNIPKSEKIVAGEVSIGQALNQLYVSLTKNDEAIHAWIPGIGAFQMTVGKKHEIKGAVTRDLARLGRANRLYWLLPPLYYDSFTKKSPEDIEQYAVQIPYPE